MAIPTLRDVLDEVKALRHEVQELRQELRGAGVHAEIDEEAITRAQLGAFYLGSHLESVKAEGGAKGEVAAELAKAMEARLNSEATRALQRKYGKGRPRS